MYISLILDCASNICWCAQLGLNRGDAGASGHRRIECYSGGFHFQGRNPSVSYCPLRSEFHYILWIPICLSPVSSPVAVEGPQWARGLSGDLEFGSFESFPSDSPCALGVCFLFQPQVPRLPCRMAVLIWSYPAPLCPSVLFHCI